MHTLNIIKINVFPISNELNELSQYVFYNGLLWLDAPIDRFQYCNSY